MFQSIYDSAWHHPFVAWVGVALLLALLVRRLPFLAAYLVVFAVEIAVDALVTGHWSPVSPAGVQTWAILFVILGDWRMLVLVERYARLDATGRPPSQAYWVAAAGLALIVPLFQAACIKLFPDVFAETRMIYLVYELAFLVLALVLRTLVIPKRMAAAPPERTRFVRGLLGFFAVQYALWSTADILILSGQEWGLALRLVPNVLYYVGFLLWVFWTAPPGELPAASETAR